MGPGCVTSRQRVKTGWFGSSRWSEEKHCDATSHSRIQIDANQLATIGKTQVTTETTAFNLSEKETRPKTTQTVLATPITTTVVRTNSYSNKRYLTKPIQTKQITEMTGNPELSTHPCGTCGKTNHPTENCYFGANAANRPPSRYKRLEGQHQAQRRDNQLVQMTVPSCSLKNKLATPRLQSGAASAKTAKLPSILGVVWEQPRKHSQTDTALKN